MKPELLETTTLASGYSLAEAEAMLPLVQAIAAEITERCRLRRGLHQVRADLDASRSPEGLITALADADEQIYLHNEGIHHAIDELVELGLTVLRTNPLTIHIPGRSLGGPLVFCWQVGDEGIRHGHRLGEEDEPRRPLRVRAPDEASQ